MIDIKCKCGEVFHADEKFVGRKIKCPNCGNIFTIQLPEIPTETFYTQQNTYNTRKNKTSYSPKRKFKHDLRRVVPILLVLLILFIIVIGYFSSRDKTSSLSDNRLTSDNYQNRPESGNVYDEKFSPPKNNSSNQYSTPTATNIKNKISQKTKSNFDNSNYQPVTPKKIKKPVDPYSDWVKTDLRTGTSPDCYNFTPTYDFAIDNKLQIKVGSSTDIVIKLCSYTTGKCIRYVYIRHGATYDITNIPQDLYYTKIAYGKDWRQKIENGQCLGKFVKNAFYKKGEQDLDFNIKYLGVTKDEDYEYTNYNIPSYSLSLDVIESDLDKNIYQTISISEEEFNK